MNNEQWISLIRLFIQTDIECCMDKLQYINKLLEGRRH